MIYSMDIDKTIGLNLRRIREAAGLSQSELADRIGSLPQRVSAYENGREGMGKDYMDRVCKALNADPWEFYVTSRTPIVTDKGEREALELYRAEKAAGVSEDVAKYGRFRIEEARKKKKH